MPNNPDTEAIVRGYLAAAAIGDLEGIWKFYSDNIVYEDTSVHQVYHGLAATKAFYVKTMGGLDVHWEVDDVIATDEGFGVGGFMAGKHIHDLPGMPATNKSFKVACASIATVRHGKITRNRDFWSNADLLEQLGFINLPR
ncbi:ester cyclase [Rhodococcus qingshengii]|uniref:ester cyclase n=1 Tax=Rhodococcus qingshengii TaxID=334542 RepID=UPI0010A5BC22|nr:ester cyclase [Rhodococcus qingshengii]THJ67686.1 ester cyclase [Rhodococcus qingshengii]